MSQADPARLDARARTFAALGDPTRLQLVELLLDDRGQSISDLSRKSLLTRQAIGKHLQVLENSGLVTSQKLGRERHFELNTGAFGEASDYLRDVKSQWESALQRLKAFVEK